APSDAEASDSDSDDLVQALMGDVESVVDPELDEIARLGTGKVYSNASRNLHNFLHRKGKTLPVAISSVKLIIRRPKKGGGEFVTDYPLIYLSSWMKYILQSGGEFLLGGWTTDQPDNYKRMLSRFWQRYRVVNAVHPIYSEKSSEQWAFCIPVAVHGDEGRGLAKLPVLVESYQPILPGSGEDKLNLVGHTYTTRLLATILPSACYAKKDQSVDGLHRAMADDLTASFRDGVTVEAGNGAVQL
ncbi:unnamed protein product, partial [Symbiodinium sp. CCMP2456]